MKFFSGFSFENESFLFKQFINSSQFTVSGFSFGAILAFEYVLHSKDRIDTLQLFSPAFFQNKPRRFLRTQLIYFQKDKKEYINNFVENSFFPNEISENIAIKIGKYEDLNKLLNFEWNKDYLKKIIKKGIKIEIFLGAQDKIIDSDLAFDFFQEFGEVCLIKNVGHTLST